ncbi:MAG TPA: hypothetical protein VHA52_05710 [Candidatus Babeliaceae bacterium]|nr:hypothetical protein [Candidatus Babeliaceae bacterium]
MSKDNRFPLVTACKVSRTFANKDLVNFMRDLLAEIDNISDRELLLFRLKNIVLQTPREPLGNLFKLKPSDFAKRLIEQGSEQIAFEPIKWIDAEIDLLRNLKAIDKKESIDKSPGQSKDLLSRAEMLQLFKFSNSTLNRRIAEGMPTIKLGAKVMFNREKVINWLNQLD